MMTTTYYHLLLGDCVVRMTELEATSFDAVTCDPPYGLVFMAKSWDKLDSGGNDTGAAQEAWHVRWLTLVFGLLKPGGLVKAYGGSRTFHRLAAAMDTVGFQDVHLEAHGYSSGFPKSLDVGRAIDKVLGKERVIVGYKRGVKGATGTGHERAMPGKAVGIKQVMVMVPVTAPASPEAILWDGWGTALKPAWEAIVVGRKPGGTP